MTTIGFHPNRRGELRGGISPAERGDPGADEGVRRPPPVGGRRGDRPAGDQGSDGHGDRDHLAGVRTASPCTSSAALRCWCHRRAGPRGRWVALWRPGPASTYARPCESTPSNSSRRERGRPDRRRRPRPGASAGPSTSPPFARALDTDPVARPACRGRLVSRRPRPQRTGHRAAGGDVAARPPGFTDPLVLQPVLPRRHRQISVAAWVLERSRRRPLEALVIATIVVLNAAIGYWQESKAIRAVDAFGRLTGTHTTVVRDSQAESVPSVELVPGDLVYLAEGDAIGGRSRSPRPPHRGGADRRERSARHGVLGADIGFRSTARTWCSAAPRSPAGGRAVVVATGMATEIGAIGDADRAGDRRADAAPAADRLARPDARPGRRRAGHDRRPRRSCSRRTYAAPGRCSRRCSSACRSPWRRSRGLRSVVLALAVQRMAATGRSSSGSPRSRHWVRRR